MGRDGYGYSMVLVDGGMLVRDGMVWYAGAGTGDKLEKMVVVVDVGMDEMGGGYDGGFFELRWSFGIGMLSGKGERGKGEGKEGVIGVLGCCLDSRWWKGGEGRGFWREGGEAGV